MGDNGSATARAHDSSGAPYPSSIILVDLSTFCGSNKGEGSVLGGIGRMIGGR